MRKTNPLHFFTFGLQRTAGPYSWVIFDRLSRLSHRLMSVLPRKQKGRIPISVLLQLSERLRSLRMTSHSHTELLEELRVPRI